MANRRIKKKQAKLMKERRIERRKAANLTLVDKYGGIKQKNVDILKSAIRDNKEYSEIERRTILSDLDQQIYQARRHPRAYDGKSDLTTNGFFGKRNRDEIGRMLRNMGYSPEEFASEYGVDVNEVLDKNNWDGTTFSYGNNVFMFQFGYNGNNLVRG